MHFRTHVKDELRGISGQDEYADGMVEHDMHIGQFLDLLDELGIADNTIVFYSTDNGPHYNTWPDAGHAVPRREEHQLGGRLARAGHGALARQDPRRLGGPTRSCTTWTGCRPSSPPPASPTSRRTSWRATSKAMGREYKVHLDGYNILPLLTGETEESPRKEIFYFSDDGDLTALRYNDWKLIFMEQKSRGPSRSGWSPSPRCACR
jgi:arylsulfatase A-like enzyme